MIPEAFALPEGQIYLLGHSLGPAPRTALDAVRRAAEHEWAQGLAASWNDADWFHAPRRLGDKIARIMQAPAGSVIVTDSVSVNVFKLAAAALVLSSRRTIRVEAETFPTDGYVAQSLADLRGDVRVERVARGALFADIGADVGLILASQIDFRTGAAFELEAMTAQARRAGARVLWDLSHSLGAVVVEADAIELAVGCGYKYLNGGPGAPGWIYAAPALADALANPIAGWFGHAAPFAFEPDYRPAPGAQRFAAGTPPILSFAALEAALDVVLSVAPRAVAAHAQHLCATFRDALGDALTCITPAAHGAHLAFTHPQAFALKTALIEAGIVGDFRPPDAIRFGFSPLFLNEADAIEAARIVGDVTAKPLAASEARGVVT